MSVLSDLGKVLRYCHEMYNKCDNEGQNKLAHINQTAKDAIEYIEKLEKENAPHKGFNELLCAELAKKNQPNRTLKYELEESKWIPCSERLPKSGENVILFFYDTFHTHPSWEKTRVLPAWRCNVGEERSPNGEWAIEGRCWNDVVIDLKDGIAWMPLPKEPEVKHD